MLICQARQLSEEDLTWLRRCLEKYPRWSRDRLARELCYRWQWRNGSGLWKTFASRSLLVKLDQRGLIQLPAARQTMRRSTAAWGIRPVGRPEEWAAGHLPSIQACLRELRPLQWQVLSNRSALLTRAYGYLVHHHYRGFNRPVGEHLVYLVQDRQDRDLAVLLFGAAAWKCAPRDRFIDWNPQQRTAGLGAIANLSRFLILPTVEVACLASHLLGQVARRINADWQERYGHRLELLESFVEVSRFKGTAFKAAQWRVVGLTTGRTRQSNHHQILDCPKAIFVRPLHANFRQHLQTAPPAL